MTPKPFEATAEATPRRLDPVRRVRGPLPVEATPAYAPEEEASLGEYLAVVARHRWLALTVAGLVLAAGSAWAFLTAPVYRADALVQVEDNKKGGPLGDLSSIFSESSPAETEIEILRSRTLTGAVVDALGLEVSAAPRRFPVIGGAIARRHRGDGPAGAWPGFARWGWGGERIAITRLDVSGRGGARGLRLVAGEGKGFELLGGDGERLLQGTVGQPARGRGIELFVAELRARPGTEFDVAWVGRERAIAGLQKGIRIAERGKKTGILELSLEGEDPARVSAVLESLARAYVRQNVDRRSAEAEKTLAFLDSQLPQLRADLEAAEARLKAHRVATGGVDVTVETQATVVRSAEVEKAIAELKVEVAGLRQRFTEAHPVLVAAAARLAKLEGERQGVEGRMLRLPESELAAARLLRDVKVANDLYLALLDKAQELKIVKSGTIGNVRILDDAMTASQPVAPRRGAVVALALLLGLALGVAAAFALHALDHGVEDPEQLERATGIPVHASIPRSAAQAGASGDGPKVLAARNPGELAVEAVRSLRTSLEFALLDAPTHVVAVTGPAPGVGKSFVTSNLAHVVAESGKRVVVVDVDLRRGRLHEVLGGARSPGLSEVLAGTMTWREAVRKSTSQGVDFIAGGERPPTPSVLLGADRLGRLVAELSAAYDLVLIDTPPILAVTDGALAAVHASVVLCVLRSGKHPMREVSAALRRFSQAGVRIDGLVLNGVEVRPWLGKRSSYHYQYSYE